MRTGLAVIRFPSATGTRGVLQMMKEMTAPPRRPADINNGFDTGVQGHEF